MNKISLRSRIGLMIFGVILCFLLLEIGMRLAGFIHISFKEAKNTKAVEEINNYKIMFLGESTTDSAYPDILKEILIKKYPDKKFSFVNKGRCGINTSIIVARLEDNLDKYDPDMVIVMMGINDNEFTKPYRKDQKLRNYTLSNFRFYKLLKLIRLHFISKITDPETINEEKVKLSRKYFSIAKRLIYDKHDYPKGQTMLKKAIIADDKNWEAYTELGLLYFTHRYCEDAIVCLKKAIKLNPDNNLAYGVMGYCYAFLGDHEFSEECFKKVNGTKERFSDVVTEYNYKKLIKIILKRDIKLVCVQYPMRSAEPLRKIIRTKEDVIIVDNELSFKKGVAEKGYDTYFIDNFAGDFGHCSEKGNELLVQNIINAIGDNY